MVVVRAYAQTLLFSCRQSCCTQQFQYFTALALIRLCIGVEYEPVGQQHRHEWARGLNATHFRLVYLTGLISAPCKACAEWRDEDHLTVFS